MVQKAWKSRRPLAFISIILVAALVVILAGVPSFIPQGVEVKVKGLNLPAQGAWNGFLGHEIEALCTELKGERTPLHFLIKDYQQNVVGERTEELPPFGSIKFMLNDYEISNLYGTYTISAVDSAADPAVRCFTNYYRRSAPGANRQFEYAVSVPVEEPLTGVVYGGFNAQNPESGNTQDVYNYLSVVNSSENNFSATVEVYDLGGKKDEVQSFVIDNLAPGQRLDRPLGHTDANFNPNPTFLQTIGSYSIKPNNLSQKFEAFNTRYSRLDDQSFNFSFSLRAKAGNCNPGPLPVSTFGPAFTWGEILPVGSKPINLTIKVSYIDQVTGEAKEDIRQRTLAPRQQYHHPVHEIIGADNVGSIEVSCEVQDDPEKKFLVQALHYGYPSGNNRNIEWAYAAEARNTTATKESPIVLPINTNDERVNWLKLIKQGGGDNSVHVDITIFARDGSEITTDFVNQNVTNTLDLFIDSQVGENFEGFVVVFPSEKNEKISAEIIKVFPSSDSPMGYVQNTPAVTFSIEEVNKDPKEEPPVIPDPPGDDDDPDVPPPVVCGNGTLENGETCDFNGNQACTVTGGYPGTWSCSSCTSLTTCEKTPVCGDEFLDDGETCDFSGSQACTFTGGYPGTQSCVSCSSLTSCEKTAVCGDGVNDNGEECDDGNTTSNDGCSNSCVKENIAARALLATNVTNMVQVDPVYYGDSSVQLVATSSDQIPLIVPPDLFEDWNPSPSSFYGIMGYQRNGNSDLVSYFSNVGTLVNNEEKGLVLVGKSIGFYPFLDRKVDIEITYSKISGTDTLRVCLPRTVILGSYPRFYVASDGSTYFDESLTDLAAQCSVCGDNKIERNEECDGGNNIAGDGCDSECKVEDSVFIHQVFLGTNLYTGNLGGLTKADSYCQSMAEDADIGGTWMAILSDDNNSAKDTIPITGPIKDTNSLLVAANASFFWSGYLNNRIEYDQFGNESDINWLYVYTGTNFDGSSSNYNCEQSNDLGMGGDSSFNSMEWIEDYEDACDYELHLYCISVEEKPATNCGESNVRF